jgi:hypothetical protein
MSLVFRLKHQMRARAGISNQIGGLMAGKRFDNFFFSFENEWIIDDESALRHCGTERFQ